MRVYHIGFTYDSDLASQVQRFEATSAGHAQEKCRRKYPGCKILETWCDARLNEGSRGSFGLVSYPTVSTSKVNPLPAIKTEETTFSFFDQCESYRPQPLRQT
jgi:hypothetical protein